MNTETSKIVERIDSSIDNILKKLVEEVAAIDLIITMRSDLKKVDSLEKIISMDFKDIAKYLGIIEPDIEVDLAQIQKNLYFYGAGLQNAVFCNSSRYIEAKDFLDGILQKFNNFSNYDSDIDSIHRGMVEENIQVYTKLKSSIEDGKIVGQVSDLTNYKALFDDSWSESDKISACTLLVKSHIEQLKREEEMRKESILFEEDKGLADKADIVSLDIERKLEERENVGTLVKPDILEEESKRVEEARNMLVPYKSILDKFCENLELVSFYEEYRCKFNNGEISYNELIETFNDNQYKEFLVHCLSSSLREFYDLSTKGYSNEELALVNNKIIGSLNSCSNFAMLLDFYEINKKQKVEENVNVTEISSVTLEVEENVPKAKLDVEEEIFLQIKNAREMVNPYVELINKKMKSLSLAYTFNGFAKDVNAGKVDFAQVRNDLTSDYYELFLAYYLNSALSNVNEVLLEEYSDAEKEEALDMLMRDLNVCSSVSVLLEQCQVEKKSLVKDDDILLETDTESLEEMVNDGEAAEIIFYSKNDGEYEIDKCLKNLSPDKQREVASLINKLGSKHFGKTTSLFKAADNIHKLKTMCGNKVFITFKKLCDDHFLVYHADETSIIGEKSSIQPMISYDPRVEEKIRVTLRDGSRLDGGTLAYRKLISDSRQKREEIRKINQEMGKGVSNE